MLISISNNKFSIENLLKQKQSQKQSRTKFNETCYTQNPKQINVISPFYDRQKCSKKGPCLCPYHRIKKKQIINLIPNKLHKLGFNKFQKQQKLKKIKTQISENDKTIYNKKIRYGSMLTQSNGKSMKDIKNYLQFQKQNYMNIGHKVECRNSEYQQFLKKNVLFGLHGKNSNTKNKQNQDDGTDIQKSSDQRYTQKVDNILKQPKNYTKIDIHHLIKDQTQKYNIEKAQELIQLVMEEKVKMRISDMKQLRQVFANLIDQSQNNLNLQLQKFEQQNKNIGQFEKYECLKKINQENFKNLQKRKNLLGKFDEFISLTQNKMKLQNERNQRKKTYKTNYEFKNDYEQKSTDNLVSSIDFLLKNKKVLRLNNQRQSNNNVNLIENIKLNDQKRPKGKNSKKLSQLIKTEQNNENNYFNIGCKSAAEENEKQKRISGFLPNPNSKMSKKKLQKYSKKGSNQPKSLHSQVPSKLSEKKTKQFDSTQKQKQTSAYQYSSYFRYNQKNQKQAKFNQIMTQINDENSNIIDKNFIKMKKYIQRNRKFIRKMEMKLLHLDLGVFVIQPTDSLITRKKKIRYLKQILSNVQKQSNSKKNFYDEIMKYLDIYTEHCDMILKKVGPKKRKQEQDIMCDDLQLQGFCFENKSSESLKFISLYQNNEQERERRLDGWISIPQYITTDYARLKATKKLEKSTKFIQQNQHISSSQSEQKYSDQLIQIPLENKCSNKIIESLYLQKQQLALKNGCKQSQIYSFESKIEEFKRKLLKTKK